MFVYSLCALWMNWIRYTRNALSVYLAHGIMLMPIKSFAKVIYLHEKLESSY